MVFLYLYPQTELQNLKEQLAIEKAAWEENYKKKQETWLLSKERDLKEHVSFTN